MTHELQRGLAEQTRSERATTAHQVSTLSSMNAQVKPYTTVRDATSWATVSTLTRVEVRGVPRLLVIHAGLGRWSSTPRSSAAARTSTASLCRGASANLALVTVPLNSPAYIATPGDTIDHPTVIEGRIHQL